MSEPSKDDLKTYFHVVFGSLSGFIPFRSFAEKDNKNSRPLKNIWIEANDEVVDKAFNFAKQADYRKAAFYVIPGTVANVRAASSSDVRSMQTLLIDIDEGDTDAKLAALTAALGEPTMIVESGGITDSGQAKLHIYWQLTKAVEDEKLRRLLELRHQIALAFGGDVHFKSAHQPIRVAGSVYHKGGKAKAVKIRSYNPVEYELEELIERFSYVPTLNNNSAINSLKTPNNATLSFSDLMTSKVYEGGNGEHTRFNCLRKVAGYWIRRCHEGLVTKEQAMEEITGYNLANVVPAWPLERIKQTVDGLWKLHLQKHGNPKEAKNLTSKQISIRLDEWTANRYSDKAPKQDYLVEAVIPMRVVTILAATGDAGKSMLLLNLALQVAGGSPIAETLGHKVAQRGTAIVFTAEDDVEEVHRRLEYLDPAGYRNEYPEKLIIIPLASVGGPLSCIIKNKEGIKVSPEFIELKKQITAISDLKLIIFDPLSSFVQADISKDPSDGSFVTSVFASLATETGAAVILAHHMRKPQGNYQINSPEDAREAVRGSGALVDGVRNVYSLWQSPQEEQKAIFSMLGKEYERNRVYRGAVVKCNSAADREVHIFFRSDQGLLEDISTLTREQQLSKDKLFLMLRSSIAYSAAQGFPYTHTGQSGIYKQRHKLPRFFHNLPRRKIEDIVQEMLNVRPALIVKGRAKGSKEEKWLDIPDGKFAKGEGEFKEGAEFIC